MSQPTTDIPVLLKFIVGFFVIGAHILVAILVALLIFSNLHHKSISPVRHPIEVSLFHSSPSTAAFTKPSPIITNHIKTLKKDSPTIEAIKKKKQKTARPQRNKKTLNTPILLKTNKVKNTSNIFSTLAPKTNDFASKPISNVSSAHSQSSNPSVSSTPTIKAQQACSIMPMPKYPRRALQAQISGLVVATFQLNATGRFRQLQYLDLTYIPSSYHKKFRRSIENALKHYQCAKNLEHATLEKTFIFSIEP